MKREIKFRGYNLKNKMWIYGYYLVNRGKHYIVQDKTAHPFDEASDFEVDPESVGQYIGGTQRWDLYEYDEVVERDYFDKEKPLVKKGFIYYNSRCGCYIISVHIEYRDKSGGIIEKYLRNISLDEIEDEFGYNFSLIGERAKNSCK